MSGTSFPGPITTVSDVEVGLVRDGVHDCGHDYHRMNAKAKSVKRQ